MVLLVLGDQVVHVAIGLGELHFVHTFTCAPMPEGSAAEHSTELFTHTFEKLLDRRRVGHERRRHLQAVWGNGEKGCLNIVWDPLDKNMKSSWSARRI